MDIFSEIYSCYYQVLDKILRAASDKAITKDNMMDIAKKYGFLESYLYIDDKISNNEWNVMKKTYDNKWKSKVNIKEHIPLTNLQKSWLKSCINDKRISLFMKEDLINRLEEYLKDVKPLYNEKDFYFFDRFNDGDDYSNPLYIENFRKIIDAIDEKKYIYVSYNNKTNMKITVIPCKIEYSSKNDKMRLICFNIQNNKKKMYILNMGKILNVEKIDYKIKEDIDVNKYIKSSYSKEPVHIIISNERNALERTMMHFANYEKNTTKLDDGTYSCKLYYNRKDETELLIDILSFGGMVKVIEPKKFVESLRERLKNQKALDNN